MALCCVVFVLVFGFCFGLCSFPINKLCFLFFNDDLGMPPTWRPHSWKKNIEDPTASLIRRQKVDPSWQVQLVTQFEGVSFYIGSSPCGFVFHFDEPTCVHPKTVSNVD